jgi:hypothetical protein
MSRSTARALPLLQRMLDFFAAHPDQASWPANTLRDRLVHGGDDPDEFEGVLAALIDTGTITTHEGARGALHVDRIVGAPEEPRLFVAIVALVDPDDYETDIYTFVVPHLDVDEDALLANVVGELNTADAEEDAVAFHDRAAREQDSGWWNVERLRAAFRITVEVQSPAMLVVGG